MTEDLIEFEHNFDIKFQSLNYLLERIEEPIEEMLFQRFEDLPKDCKIHISIEFKPNSV